MAFKGCNEKGRKLSLDLLHSINSMSIDIYTIVAAHIHNWNVATLQMLPMLTMYEKCTLQFAKKGLSFSHCFLCYNTGTLRKPRNSRLE